MFLLDTRESDLIKILEGAEVKQLPVADIWLGVDSEGKMMEGGVIIERKSIRDLEASILDGRYREQRGRILSYCQENKTQPMYILEGARNLCFAMSGISRAFDERVTKMGILPGYFALNLSASP